MVDSFKLLRRFYDKRRACVFLNGLFAVGDSNTLGLVQLLQQFFGGMLSLLAVVATLLLIFV